MLVFAADLEEVEEIGAAGVDADQIFVWAWGGGGEGGDEKVGGGGDVGGHLDGAHGLVGGGGEGFWSKARGRKCGRRRLGWRESARDGSSG